MKLVRFEFSPEIIQKFRDTQEIPAHFYNKDGQILIYKKDKISDEEIDRLLRFENQGIYYNLDDEERIHGKKKKRNTPDGLTDTKLLSEQAADDLSKDVGGLFDDLKKTTFNSLHAKRSSERLNQVFDDFQEQPDMMNGLVNIIELMTQKDSAYEVELAVKRTVVAMAMKTRGMFVQNYKDKKKVEKIMNDLMMGAMLCDISYAKMKLPDGKGLNKEQMDYIRTHPLISYLMVAHDPNLSFEIKKNILLHHRPIREGMGNNNYPSMRALKTKLLSLFEKHKKDRSKIILVQDLEKQIKYLSQSHQLYDEDVNIIAIASEFASLTTKVPWRPAFDPVIACKMIINNSYFTYSERVLRDFLDNVSISLCDNEKIILEGDFLILAAHTQQGKTYFEVAIVTNIDRYQSRPGITRMAFIKPYVAKEPKIKFFGFDPGHLQLDPRFAHYEMKNDDTRHIVYIIDKELDEDLFVEVRKIAETNSKLKKLVESREMLGVAVHNPDDGGIPDFV